jgi:hypothetical protein
MLGQQALPRVSAIAERLREVDAVGDSFLNPMLNTRSIITIVCFIIILLSFDVVPPREYFSL